METRGVPRRLRALLMPTAGADRDCCVDHGYVAPTCTCDTFPGSSGRPVPLGVSVSDA
jgi:hypothetical protein